MVYCQLLQEFFPNSGIKYYGTEETLCQLLCLFFLSKFFHQNKKILFFKTNSAISTRLSVDSF